MDETQRIAWLGAKKIVSTEEKWGKAEELRAAATLRATLTGQLMAGGVALIGVVGAVSVFSLTNGLWWVLLPAIPAAGCFAWGIYAGGRGIENMAQTVEKGMDDNKKPYDTGAHEDFSRVRWRFQRGLELLFVTAVVAALPINKKPTTTEQIYGIAQKMLEVAEATTKAASTRDAEVETARRRIEALERDRAALSKRLDALENCTSRRRMSGGHR